MSDEEEYSEEEVEVEEDVEEVEPPSPVKTPESKRAPVPVSREDEEPPPVNEAMAAAAKKRTTTGDDAAKLQDYEDRRRAEREREEEELRMLKEKQEQRRVQREEEEREMEERRRADEERRREEEDERKARMEAQKQKREDEKKRRQQAMMGVGFPSSGGRNFTLPDKKSDNSDKFGNIVQAKQEMGLTKDQREEAKKAYIAQVLKNIGEISSMNGQELKGKVKEMHQRICKLEAEKYDLEKRVHTQEYDLKELNERQRQINRHKMKQKGMDPDSASSRYPPKVSVASKYDRQIDRRNFRERRAIYDKKNAYPCFPNVPPPSTILEFKLTDPGSPRGDANEDEEEEEE